MSRLGISYRDSRWVKVAKLCYLIPLMPLFLVIGVLLHGVPEVWRAVLYLPEEWQNIWSKD